MRGTRQGAENGTGVENGTGLIHAAARTAVVESGDDSGVFTHVEWPEEGRLSRCCSYHAIVAARPCSKGVEAVKPNSALARDTSRQRRGWPSGLVLSQTTRPLKPAKRATVS